MNTNHGDRKQVSCHNQEYQKSLADHIRSNRKCITNISNMVLKALGMHLSEKFCRLSSDWRTCASRPAHLRIWHFCYDLSNPKALIQPDCTAHASKSAFCLLLSPHSPWTQSWVFFPTDGWTSVFFWPSWCWKRAICCSTHIQGTQTCDHAITWTTGECLRRFVLCVCLHVACLVIFSWMPSQQVIERLSSGFYEPETSHAHAKMLWHRWFYLNAVDRSVWCAFTLLFIVLAI